MSFQWTGADEMIRRVADYGDKMRAALRAVAEYWAPVLEAAAKEDAPWTDRTGNARQGLHAFVEDLSKDTVALYLAHGVEYGVFLELKYAGAYSIILPTLEAHYGEIARMLKGIFG